MRKIDKGYAVIYIDDENLLSNSEDYVNDEIISAYYDTPGSLQWNYYIIIPKVIKDLSAEQIKDIESNDKYARKYIIDNDKIDEFLNERFPSFNMEDCTFTLVTGESYIEARVKLDKINIEGPNNSICSSLHRQYNSMDTLEKMDIIRAEMIITRRYTYYYTHMEREISWIRKKFDFLGENFKTI